VTLAAVILAAGASTRMGRPKALIEWQGRPFFVHCAERAAAVGCAPIVAVWGAVPLPEADGVRCVENSQWERGPLSSLQCGIRAVMESGVSGVLVMTVDRPHVAVKTLRALVDAHRAQPGAVVQPRLGDASGHPVVHPTSVMTEILELSPEDTVRTVLGRTSIRDSRVRVPVDDAAVLDNLDTPADLDRLPGR